MKEPQVLRFDREKIDEMKNKLNDVSEKLEVYKKSVLTNIEELRRDWNTEAGRKFMQDVNTNWAYEVDKYIKIVGAVAELLQKTSEDFAQVEDAVDKFRFY